MDASYITPFVKSIQNVFSTMLQLPVTVNTPQIKQDSTPTHDVSGIIGMSGDVIGTVILSFKTDAAESIVALEQHHIVLLLDQPCGGEARPARSDDRYAHAYLLPLPAAYSQRMFRQRPCRNSVGMYCLSIDTDRLSIGADP